MKPVMKKFGIAICGMAATVMLLCNPHSVKAQDYGNLEFDKVYEFTDDDDYEYTITLPSSGALNFKFIADGSAETRINMEDEYGKSVTKAYRWYDSYYGSYNTIYNLKAGVYKIRFHGSVGDPLATGRLQCAFKSANETYPEDLETTNDEASVASVIAKPQSANITGQFAINDSTDCYTFILNKTGNVSVGFKSGLKSVSLQLYNDAFDLEHRVDDMAAGTHKYTYTLPAGTYYLVLRNEDTSTTGTYALTVKTVDLKKSAVNSAKSTKKKTATVSVKKVAGVTGYQIQMATNSSFTKNKKTVNVTTNKATVKKLKSKKKYYVRVRTYTVVENNEKCYSAWSKAKKVNIK